MHALYSRGVLCGEGRDCRGAVAAQGGDGLQVGLDAGSPAAVATGDGQDSGRIV